MVMTWKDLVAPVIMVSLGGGAPQPNSSTGTLAPVSPIGGIDGMSLKHIIALSSGLVGTYWIGLLTGFCAETWFEFVGLGTLMTLASTGITLVLVAVHKESKL
mgnify:CR=1 FL=1